MALHETTESTGQFLVIKHGGICLESKEPKEGYDQITVHNPKTGQDQPKWIKRFKAVDGKVKRIEWYNRETDFGTFMGVKIHLRDKGEYYQLDLPFNTRAFDSFSKLVENIDFTQPVEFSAWFDKEGHTAFCVRQDGGTVKWKYTKDNMGDCPEPKKSKLGKWNFDEQREWLVDRIVNVVIPHVDELNKFDEPEPEYTDEPRRLKAATAFYENEPPMPPMNVNDMDEPDSIPF